jgi:uncharacterized YccA/Bax inhibitor family protein
MAHETVSHAVDATLAAIGWNTAKGGAVATFFGWLLSSEGAALVGIVGVIGGLVIQLIFRRRQDRREQEAHDRRMAMYGDH